MQEGSFSADLYGNLSLFTCELAIIGVVRLLIRDHEHNSAHIWSPSDILLAAYDLHQRIQTCACMGRHIIGDWTRDGSGQHLKRLACLGAVYIPSQRGASYVFHEFLNVLGQT